MTKKKIDGAEVQILKTQGITIKPETEVGKKLLDMVKEGKADLVPEYKEKDGTLWNKQQEEEDKKKEQLPIDKIIEIADKQGLLPKELTAEQKWERFIRGINLSDILKDCMQSSMNEFCKMYNNKEENKKENIQFKLHIRKMKEFKPKKGVNAIFGNELVLELRRNDKYMIVQKKTVTFTHVKELKDEASWRYALYASMYQELVNFALTLILVNDESVRGTTK